MSPRLRISARRSTASRISTSRFSTRFPPPRPPTARPSRRPRKKPRKLPRPPRGFARRVVGPGPPLSQGDGQLPAPVAGAGSRDRQADRGGRERGRIRSPQLAGHARFRDRAWASGSKPARPTCATSSRRPPRNPPTPMRSAAPRPTRSSARSWTSPRASSKSCAPSSKKSTSNWPARPGPRRKPRLEKKHLRYKDRIRKELEKIGLSRRVDGSGDRRDAPPADRVSRLPAPDPALRGSDRPAQEPAPQGSGPPPRTAVTC